MYDIYLNFIVFVQSRNTEKLPITGLLKRLPLISSGEGLVNNINLDNIKKWTISIYKRQSLYEKLEKTSKTMDLELEN